MRNIVGLAGGMFVVRAKASVCLTLAVMLCMTCGAQEEGVPAPDTKDDLRIEMDTVWVSVLEGDQLLMRYRYAHVPYKPYVDEFYTPSHINVLRDSPWDHKHHHALMYAVTVDDINFWEEHKAPGRQVHRGLRGFATGPDSAQFTQRLDWIAPDDAHILAEERTLTVHRDAGIDTALLTWTSRFTLPQGKEKAVLTGGHYHGLGMRFVQSMDADGTFRNVARADGEVVRGDEKLTPAAWCAYSAEADGNPVTAAMFDAPDNPRPALWFTMHTPFAFLSATMNTWKEPLEVTPGEPLVVRYGVALWDGAAQTKDIAATYRRWSEWAAPTPK